MATPSSEHIKVARLQQRIGEHLGLSVDRLVFEYKGEQGTVLLNLVTINPDHEQTFLFHSVKGVDKVDALEKMLEYVESYKEKEDSWTIQWSTRARSELQTSYFRGKNIYEVLEKFYYGRDLNSTVIYSIVLSPIA